MNCAKREAGSCVMCENIVSIAEAQLIDSLIVCNACFGAKELIWCPKCGKSHPYSGYLRVAFRNDLPCLHAAALVTHYRHKHVQSHDRAWQNPYYANKIPGYDYEEYKATVNNRAKRQLIRAIAKRLQEANYPADAPIDALQLICAFKMLRENDEKTESLIDSVVAKFGEPST